MESSPAHPTSVGSRDRHGRGARSPLLPPAVPRGRTRSQRFESLVLDVVEELSERYPRELAGIDFDVADVPGPSAEAAAAHDADPVPLGAASPADARHRPLVVLFRRPIESRAPDGALRAELVHDVVVDLVAQLLGMDPDALDPPL